VQRIEPGTAIEAFVRPEQLFIFDAMGKTAVTPLSPGRT
jgi:hypothetical protein